MAQQYSLPLGLDMAPNTKDAENLQDFYRLYNACKLLAEGLDAYTGIVGLPTADWGSGGTSAILLQNMCRFYAQFSVSVTTGQIVGLNASGQIVLSTPGTAIGWSPAPISAGNWGEVRLLGLHTAVSGLTSGTAYYASSTAGGITATVTAQKVGVALAANRLFFNPA